MRNDALHGFLPQRCNFPIFKIANNWSNVHRFLQEAEKKKQQQQKFIFLFQFTDAAFVLMVCTRAAKTVSNSYWRLNVRLTENGFKYRRSRELREFFDSKKWCIEMHFFLWEKKREKCRCRCNFSCIREKYRNNNLCHLLNDCLRCCKEPHRARKTLF